MSARVRPTESESAKDRHIDDVNALLAAIAEHPNRATAAYLMAIVSVMTNFQGSRSSLEQVHSVGLESPTITRKLRYLAVDVALKDVWVAAQAR